MSRLFPRRRYQRSLGAILLILICFCLGQGLSLERQPAVAQGGAAIATPLGSTPTNIGTVDPVSARYQRGQTLYLKNCASCHIGLPPAVLPTQTWAELIQDPEHYGAQLPTIAAFDRQQIDQYLSTYSRSLRQDEAVPYRLSQARHFHALHPQVELPRPLTIASCASCHPKADGFNFRELSGN